MSTSYRLLRAIVQILCRGCSRFEIVGLENLPPGGPLILVMNHIHLLDTVAVMTACPWQVTALAARKWERSPAGILLRAARVIFINRGEVDRQALRQAVATLKAGGVLGIAPEGTRSRSRQLQPARGGVAYLACLSGAPLLPVAVTGVEHVLPSLLRLRRATVRVTFGRPFTLPALDHKPRSGELLDLADTVMLRLAEILPEEYRGVYGAGGQAIERAAAPQG